MSEAEGARRGGDAKRARMTPRDDSKQGVIPATLQAWVTTQFESAREKARAACDACSMTAQLSWPLRRRRTSDM